MGVPQLNSIILSQCPGAVEKVHLSSLANKRVSIDASIFMYRYKEKNSLLENTFNLVNLFKKYNIIACFVFDGKPPDEKYQLLKERKEERDNAYLELIKCEETIKQPDITPKEREELVERINLLKTKSTRLTAVDIANVKDLLRSMGVVCIEACGEADGLCAKMAIKKYVHACVSDDMDMFVYGCPVVWRHLSLLQETVVVYDLDKICSSLNVTREELKEICVASGTDYLHRCSDKTNLSSTFKLFNRYKRSKLYNQPFYDWLDEHTKYIDNMCLLYSSLALFETRYVYLDQKVIGKKGGLRYNSIDENTMKEVMSKENFYFPL